MSSKKNAASHFQTGLALKLDFCRGPGSLPGFLCLPPLLAERFCWDAPLCRQDVLQGDSTLILCTAISNMDFPILYIFVINPISSYSTTKGLVEFNLFCQLLSHLECRSPRLAVLLRVSGLPVGEWLCNYVFFFTFVWLKKIQNIRNYNCIVCYVLVFSLLLLFQMSNKRFRAAAMLLVFTVSAVVHEYILAVCFGFFYPVLFCLFMCFGSKHSVFSSSVENHFNPLIVTILLKSPSSYFDPLQWCSTSFYMTKGKDQFGTSSCGHPSSWVRVLLSVFTRRSGMPSVIVPLKR